MHKDNLAQSRKVRCDTAKYRRVYISHNQQHWTHLLGRTPEFDAKSKCPTGPRTVNTLPPVVTKISAATFWKERIKLAKRMLIGIGTDLQKETVHLDRLATFHRKERMEEDKSLAGTVAAVHCKGLQP